VYARTLFQIAGKLGLTQKEIASRLGISHTPVSLWASGKRPVSIEYRDRLVALIGDEIAAREQRGEPFDADFRELLVDWVSECRERRGTGPSAQLYDDFQALIATYGNMDKEAFIAALTKDEHRQCLYDFCVRGKQDIETLDRVLPVELSVVEKAVERLTDIIDGGTDNAHRGHGDDGFGST
jgi:transcriptional regulator with XRE-family HTH domain